ncbi:hypothetical protein KC19_7G093000 [Ceratodon purpureus]|uniref:F-box domain-containing protein n=1 Tax=Ceratodon purpureus TaxID=3225 RepID=A0A8T0H4K3_CERPU|nr:hypothetical protein KC19_7G093000 [Ceratodon purpureus]KAG0566856.1 hypothetical protein KC19_7G093000 [Ceratodon purpureus]
MQKIVPVNSTNPDRPNTLYAEIHEVGGSDCHCLAVNWRFCHCTVNIELIEGGCIVEMEIKDECLLGLANVLAVKATGAEITGADVVLLGDILNSQERKKLLERAFSMRNKLDLLIKHLTSSKTGGSSSRKRKKFKSRTTEVDVPPSESPKRKGTAVIEKPNECCEHLCSFMNPALWSTLPTELLQMVFARLPFPQVYQDLRLLSKQWKWNATAGDSELNRARSEVNPKFFAMLFDHVWVTDDYRFSESYMYDAKDNLWRLFPRQEYGKIMSASGGLVCCVSSSKLLTKVLDLKTELVKKLVTEERSLRISVCNPLTRQFKELPSHPLNFDRPPLMVDLKVNHDSKYYEVIVVGIMDAGIVGKWCAAMIYNSGTGEWSAVHNRGQYKNPLFTCIFGCELQWGDEKAVRQSDRKLRLCAFDFAAHQFLLLGDPGIGQFISHVHGSALVGDRIFVLHKEIFGGEYYILEYQGQTVEPIWVKLRTHKCHHFGIDLHKIYTLRLDACEGFLMVTATNTYGRTDTILSSGYQHDLAWLYDLGTGEWKSIKAHRALVGDPGPGIMCELRWDAVP